MGIPNNDLTAVASGALRDKLNVPGAIQPEYILHASGLYLRNADTGYFHRFYPAGILGGEMATFGPPVGGGGHIGPLAPTSLALVRSIEQDYYLSFTIGSPSNAVETPDVIEVFASRSVDAVPVLLASRDWITFPPYEFRVNASGLFRGDNIVKLRTSNSYGFTYSTNSITITIL